MNDDEQQANDLLAEGRMRVSILKDIVREYGHAVLKSQENTAHLIIIRDLAEKALEAYEAGKEMA